MFLKIYKHSFLAPLKTLIPLIVIQLALGIFGGISSKVAPLFEYNLTLTAMFTTLSTLSSMAISMLLFVEIFIVFSSFRKAVATDEAYLTYTLPATVGQQLGARTLSIATWYVVATLATGASFAIYSVFAGRFLFGVTGEQNASVEFSWLAVEVVLLIVVCLASVLVHSIFGVLLAQKLSTKTKTKSANAITALIGFAEGFLLLFIFVMVMVGLLSSDNVAVVKASPHIIIWFLIVLLGSLGGLCYFLSYKLMGRWLNLA